MADSNWSVCSSVSSGGGSKPTFVCDSGMMATKSSARIGVLKALPPSTRTCHGNRRLDFFHASGSKL